MIEQIETSREDLLEFRVSGTVSDSDYKSVLMPALEAAIEAHDRIRLLIRFESDFRDFTMGALLDDARMGLKHWRGFDRVAVATDRTWIARAVKGFSIFLPCPVMTFPLGEVEEARRWLVQSLGSVHQTDLGDGVLHVQLRGKMDSKTFAEEAKDLGAFIEKHPRFRLLLDMRDFDGWQGLAAVGEHLKVVREHHARIERAAIVGDAGWQKMGERLLSNFSKGRTRYFTSAEFQGAEAWLKEEPATS
jgi:hypothetical protein